VNTRVAEDNSTPLHKACAGSKAGHQASVKLLIEGNADVHALNKWRETPLLTAANHGQATSVKLLLDAGADPCKCTDTGWSPLSIAAYKGHDEVVRLLLEEGAPTEEEDPTLSALLQAATKGLPETVDLLLRNGADHTVTTKKGDTALSILVEQNLIDAAVDMVTVYNASIPRCSRDRKKVQRARLLINLRMKQLERESKNHSGSTDEDESDDDGSHGSHTSQNLDDDGAEAKLKHRKKRDDAADAASGMTAEAIARAAEEALLQELELEAAKARKDEAEANSKRAKKKKKKEQHRQQRIKEEEDRRQRELEEAEERERVLKEKEDKKRKEQEAKEQEKREREIKELMERQKAMVAKKKERERRERVHTKQREKDGSTSSPTSSDGSDKRVKTPKPQASVASEVDKSLEADKIPSPRKNSSPASRKVAPLPGNRRWETKQKTSAISPGASVVSPQMQEASTLPSAAANRAKDSAVPSTVLTPRPQDVEATGPEPHDGYPSRNSPESVFSGTGMSSVSSVASPSVEHPAVSVFRREKVFELVQRCSDSMNVDSKVIKRALYRWIVRAAHDTTPFVDPLIPSWKDINKLVAYFQRQFIADQRRGLSSSAVGPNMEVLKEAGTAVALLCQGLADEVEQFRLRIEENVQPNWTDASVETNCQEIIGRDGLPVLSLSWKSRYEVHVPAPTFAALRERYRGVSNRLMTTIFVAKIWYETRDFVVANTGLDIRLPKETQARLSVEAGVTKEVWGDPFSVHGRNGFSGGFENLDCSFGGDPPFGKYDLSLSDSLVREGGSISVLPPLDNVVASTYIRRIVDLLESADRQGVPLSAAIFLPYECFPDLPNGLGPGPDDLKHIDPRLSEPRRFALHVIEALPASQHAYSPCGSPGDMVVSHHQTLFLLLQNVGGKARFPVSGASLRSILEPMLVAPVRRENPVVTPMVFPSDFGVRDTPRTPQSVFLSGMAQVSPDPQRVVHSDIRTMGVPSMAKSFVPVSFDNHRSSRHGRLFDLVDDVEDDPLNDVDLVSGMLNNLDVGLFQNGNVAPDIDIEAISLMGIGGPPSQPPLAGNIPRRRFG
jgi:ankyrin repeat protein